MNPNENTQPQTPAPGDVVQNQDGSTTVHLRAPFEHAKVLVDRITVHEPNAAELEALDKGTGNVSASNQLIAELSGLSLMAVRKLKARDWATVSELVNEWVGKPQATGGTS